MLSMIMDSTSTAVAKSTFKSMVARACQEREERDGEKQMIETLTKMMNNSEYSDLVFHCNDGVSLYASRLWLCARSVVFLKGLSPGVTEITLDDISSPVLSIVFEFLYTGSVQSYNSKSRRHVLNHDQTKDDEIERWSKGLDAIRAARHLLLPDLENLIWNSLIMDVHESIRDKDLTNTSVRLSSLRKLVSDYDSVDGGVEETISVELVRILDRGWLGMISLTDLSQEALFFLLKNTRRSDQSQSSGDNDSTTVICIREYLRLRQVLLWCVSQRVQDVDSAVKIIDECLPSANAALQLLKEETDNCGVMTSIDDPSPRPRVRAGSLLTKASAGCGFRTKFFPLMSLRLIHPVLLVKVLEPLKIIPPSRFMEAYRFHALKRLFRASFPTYTWKHSGSFTVSGDGTILEKIRGPSGTAVVSSPTFWQDRIYKWNVIFDRGQFDRESCGFEWEIGMLMSDTSQILFRSSTNVLSGHSNGWALRKNSDGKILIKQAAGLRSKSEATDWILYATTAPCSEAAADDAAPEIRVGVHLNMLKRTCSFRLNDVDLGLAWSDLPRKYYFPAVSFSSMHGTPQDDAANFGRARVELLDGFEVEEEESVRKKPRSVSSKGSRSSISLESGLDISQSDIIEVASHR